MIAWVVDYVIDPAKIEAFARRWIDLVERHGGVCTERPLSGLEAGRSGG